MASGAAHTPSADTIGSGRRLIRLDDGGLSLSERMTARLQSLWWRTPLHRLKLRGKHPLKLIAVPEDPVPGDRARGNAMLEGAILFHGEQLSLTDLDFAVLDVEPAFEDYLQSFEWLRDLDAVAGKEEAVPIAERLMRNWLEGCATKVAEKSWRADRWGRRLIFWAAYAPLILSSQDLVYRSAVLNAMARGARHLDNAAPKMRLGASQIEAWTGICAAGLLVQGGDPRIARGEAGLAKALSHSLTADGGIVCRAPVAQLRIVEALAMLRAAYDVRRREFPAPFQSALSYAVPALLGATHGDGGLGSWQGGLPVSGRRVGGVIEASGERALPLKIARDWGYHRMQAGDVAIVVDAAPPPPARLDTGGCASTLAFELSDGAHRLVVNCGGASGTGLTAAFASRLRTTAAHSALILADSNSTAINPDGSLGKGVVEVGVERHDGELVSRIEAMHDGYVRRHGFIHQRHFALSGDGGELRGEDILLPAGRKKSGDTPFAIRFHLAPEIEVIQAGENKGVLLRIDGGPTWHFRCAGAEAGVDESVWIDEHSQACTTKQLVITGEASPGGATVGWVFRRAG